MTSVIMGSQVPLIANKVVPLFVRINLVGEGEMFP